MLKSRNLVDMFKNMAQQLNAAEFESIKVSEDLSPTAKYGFFSGTENASDSVNSSEQWTSAQWSSGSET